MGTLRSTHPAVLCSFPDWMIYLALHPARPTPYPLRNAAADADILPGNPAGFIADQKKDYTSNVLRLAYSTLK